MSQSKNLVVQKYGGVTLATPEKIKSIAQRIQKRYLKGDAVIVVTSAMGQTTDNLLDLAYQVSSAPHRRELDMMLSTGERVAMSLLAMALHDRGVPAISLTGSQSGIITSDAHTDATIIDVRPIRIKEALDSGKVVLVAGFQGVSEKKEITTLGRGGSDTTAVALANHFRANCEILKDVDGFFTADPRLVPEARLLSQCSYPLLENAAAQGAKLIHVKAARMAHAKSVPLWLGHADHEHKGTHVNRDPMPPTRVVTSRHVLVIKAKRALSHSEHTSFLQALQETQLNQPDLTWNQKTFIFFETRPQRHPNHISTITKKISNFPIETTAMTSLVSLVRSSLDTSASGFSDLLQKNKIPFMDHFLSDEASAFLVAESELKRSTQLAHTFT